MTIVISALEWRLQSALAALSVLPGIFGILLCLVLGFAMIIVVGPASFLFLFPALLFGGYIVFCFAAAVALWRERAGGIISFAVLVALNIMIMLIVWVHGSDPPKSTPAAHPSPYMGAATGPMLSSRS